MKTGKEMRREALVAEIDRETHMGYDQFGKPDRDSIRDQARCKKLCADIDPTILQAYNDSSIPKDSYQILCSAAYAISTYVSGIDLDNGCDQCLLHRAMYEYSITPVVDCLQSGDPVSERIERLQTILAAVDAGEFD